MKSPLLPCILLLFLSCGNEHKKPIDVKSITIRKDTTIVGFWTICSTTSANGPVITYNVCPTVSFYANGRGISAEETFTWMLKKDTLYLFSARKDNNDLLPKGKYKVFFRKNNSPADLELDLIDSTKAIYYLSRSISIKDYL